METQIVQTEKTVFGGNTNSPVSPQSANALVEKPVTVSGSSICFNALQCEKPPVPIDFKP